MMKKALCSSFAPLLGEFISETGHAMSEHLLSFDRFCSSSFPGEASPENAIYAWLEKRDGEPRSSYMHRTGIVRTFGAYANRKGWVDIPMSSLIPKGESSPDGGRANVGPRSNFKGPRPFKSLLAWQFEAFVERRMASDRWNKTYDDNLHFFDGYCLKNFPDATALDDEMLGWCEERPTEHGNSCRYRTTVVWNFAEYSNFRGWSNVKIDRCLSDAPCTYAPHIFTDEEVSSFMDACIRHFDECLMGTGRTLDVYLDRLEFPVFVLFILSTGVRTCEARWLDVADVDLDQGIATIVKSKQPDCHPVSLHPSLVALLRDYGDAVSAVMPGRKAMFPGRDGGYHAASWESYHFRKIWRTVSDEPACLYDLRATFVTNNISSWDVHGPELGEKMLRLSRTLGHKSISSTYRYFRVSDLLAGRLEEKSDGPLDDIIKKAEEYGKK